MRTASALAKLAVFTVVTVLATAVLAATIGNFRLGPTRSYAAVFSDVTGLLPGDDVRIAGVRVGTVERLAVVDRSLARVRFTVAADQPLFTSTRAVLRYRNLVGQRYVALVEGPGPTSPLRPGATIPLRQTQPALDLDVLFNGFKPLFAALDPGDVNRLADELIRTLQGEGGTIDSLLVHTASLTATLADRDQVIGDLVDQLDTVLVTVDQRDHELGALITQLERLVAGLAADRGAIGASLVNIDALVTTTAGLAARARPPLAADVAQLGRLSRTLAGNRATIDGVLARLPGKLETITRTATYGSWFNFYLCDLTGTVAVPGVATVFAPDYHVSAARCG